MCGIAGIFHHGTPKPVDPARVARMCETLAHRGPDGSGVWTAPGVGLGHRRLSIIDLAGSPQPMASADGRALLSFNGEIYNYRALRRELQEQGARFRTDGDSEVILAAWQRWGPDCLRRLHGMFAFAIYDLDTRQLFLARDRLGVKPLYIADLPDGSIAFASEMKALLAHPLLRREVDPLAVDDYLAWGFVPEHRSILKHVRKLMPGHFLLAGHDTPLPEQRQWWDVSFAARARAKTDDLEAELLHLMRESVGSRMVSDVPLGAFLSGGVDSSSVVALMSEASAAPVTTCSIGFDVAAFDESAHASKVAGLFDTQHHARTVSPDDWSAVDTLASVYDEPFADASALPTLAVSRLAREHVKVALSGDGADEAFAGYRRHKFHAAEERVRAILPRGMREPLFGTLGKVYPKADWLPRPLRAKSTLQSLAGDGASAYAQAVGVTHPVMRNALYSDDYRRIRGDYRAETVVEKLMRDAPGQSGLDAAQYADLKFFLPGDILTKVDRASMAASLEAREPLLDHRLVEFAARLPERHRLRRGEGKWLVKKSMQRFLPNEILYRPKQGFVTPIAQWLRGPLAEEARKIARGSWLSRTGWFREKPLLRLAEQHIAGRADNSRVLWQMLMLEKALSRIDPR